jgi:hypothetical protein
MEADKGLHVLRSHATAVTTANALCSGPHAFTRCRRSRSPDEDVQMAQTHLDSKSEPMLEGPHLPPYEWGVYLSQATWLAPCRRVLVQQPSKAHGDSWLPWARI